MKSDVEKKFQLWNQKKLITFSKYGKGAHLWENIGKHPLDKLFIELAKIYLEANQPERTMIEDTFNNNSFYQWQLIVFVRRIAKLTELNNSNQLIRYGLVIAAIERRRYDFRDTIISLVILKYAAEKIGADISLFIDEISLIASPEMSGIFNNIRNHPQSSVLHTIKKFGPPDWANQIK